MRAASASKEPQPEELSKELQHLEAETTLRMRELQLEVRDLKRRLDWIYYILCFFGIAGSFAIWNVIRWARKRIRQAIEKAIYAMDPTLRPVHVPTERFDDETQRLRELGFRKISPYSAIETAGSTGLVVFRAEEDADLELLNEFLREKHPDPDSVGYVVYTTRRVPEPLVDNLVSAFSNITFANSPATIGHALFVVGRGLRR